MVVAVVIVLVLAASLAVSCVVGALLARVSAPVPAAPRPTELAEHAVARRRARGSAAVELTAGA